MMGSDYSVKSMRTLFESIDRVYVEKGEQIQSLQQPQFLCYLSDPLTLRILVISGSVVYKDASGSQAEWKGSSYSTFQQFYEVLQILLSPETPSVALVWQSEA